MDSKPEEGKAPSETSEETKAKPAAIKPTATGNKGTPADDKGGDTVASDDGVKGADEAPADGPEASVNVDEASSDDMTSEVVAEARQLGYNDGYQQAMNDMRDESPAPAEAPKRIYAEDRFVRAEVVAVVMAMPLHMRVGALKPRYDEFMAFVVTFAEYDQIDAARLMKFLAEHRPSDILSGRYKQDVRSAIKLINGFDELEALPRDIKAEQEAAAARLARISRPNAPPPDFKEGPNPGNFGVAGAGTEEQQEAIGRLYSGKGAT